MGSGEKRSQEEEGAEGPCTFSSVLSPGISSAGGKAPVRAKSLQSCLTLCDPVDYIARQASLSMGFSRQGY